MRIKLIVAVFFLSWLFLIATPAKADTVLQVDFHAEFWESQPTPFETVTGSFWWDRDTRVFSNISITSTGPFTFLPEIFGARYVQAGEGLNLTGQPVGALFFLSFPDITSRNSLTLDYNQHPPFDVPIFGPGSYAPEWFLGGQDIFVFQNNGPSFVTATEVVTTPEPKTLLLLIVTGVCLAFFKFKGKAA